MSDRHQEESLVSTWADGQQKVLEDWLDLMQGLERPSHSATWNETMKSWQTAVQETLDVQTRWLRDWNGRVQVTSGSPTELRKNVQQAQVLLLRWTSVQRQLWQDWFHLVGHLGPLLAADFQIDEHLLSSLQECGQEMIHSQTEWVRLWTADMLDQ
jgi:hypothetical protein